MENFLNFYSINSINWHWVSNNMLLFVYFYFLIYYTKVLFLQQLLSFENDFGKRIANKLVFFIKAFLFTSVSLLLGPLVIIICNSFEEPNMHIVNLMIVSSIVIVLYCIKNTFTYVYLEYAKSLPRTMIEEQESKLKRNQKG